MEEATPTPSSPSPEIYRAKRKTRRKQRKGKGSRRGSSFKQQQQQQHEPQQQQQQQQETETELVQTQTQESTSDELLSKGLKGILLQTAPALEDQNFYGVPPASCEQEEPKSAARESLDTLVNHWKLEEVFEDVGHKQCFLVDEFQLAELMDFHKRLDSDTKGKTYGLLLFDFYRNENGERVFYREHVIGAFWQSEEISPNVNSDLFKPKKKKRPDSNDEYIEEPIKHFNFALYADSHRNEALREKAIKLTSENPDAYVFLLRGSYADFAKKHPEKIWRKEKEIETRRRDSCSAVELSEIIPSVFCGSDQHTVEFKGENDFCLRVRSSEEAGQEMTLEWIWTFTKGVGGKCIPFALYESEETQDDDDGDGDLDAVDIALKSKKQMIELDVPKEIDLAISFIKKVVDKGGRVLVHCASGVLTSPAVVVAYLIERCEMGYRDAFAFVETKRRPILLYPYIWEVPLRQLYLDKINTSKALITDQDKQIQSKVMNVHFTGFLPTEILPHLYLGGVAHVSAEVLGKLGITNVISVADDAEIEVPHGVTALSHLLADDGSSDMIAVISRINDFIDLVEKKSEKVLLHCKIGVNRSASLVVAYLIARRDMTLEQAIRYVRARRPVIDPTPSYLLQLIHFEKTVRKVSSVSINEIGDLLMDY